MKRLKIQDVIVVEGKHDAAKIKAVVDGDVLITNGTHISSAFMQLLKNMTAQRGVIIFTDPDSPGQYIRRKLHQAIPNAKHAVLTSQSHKIGVEHASEEEIVVALKHAQALQATQAKSALSHRDMYDLKLMGHAASAALRDQLCKQLHLPKANGKTLRNYLVMLNLNKHDVEALL